jgi:hypothetical protein
MRREDHGGDTGPNASRLSCFVVFAALRDSVFQTPHLQNFEPDPNGSVFAESSFGGVH